MFRQLNGQHSNRQSAAVPRSLGGARYLCCLLLLFSPILLARPVVTSCVIDLSFWSSVEGDSKRGIYHDLHRELYRRADIEDFRIVVAPYPRLLDLLETGQCDVSTSLPPRQLSNLLLGTRYWQIRVGVVAAQGRALSDYQSLRGLRIGLLKDATMGVSFDDDLELTKVQSPRFSNLVDMLAHGHIDAIAGDLDVISGIAEQKQLPLGASLVMQSMELKFIMPANSAVAEQFDRLDQIWQQMVAEGYVRERVLWYFSQ